MNKKIVIVATEGDATRFLYHAIEENFGVSAVIIEDHVSKSFLLKRRIKNLGLLTVTNQLLFMVLIQPFLKKNGQKRIEEIIQTNKLNRNIIPEEKIIRVSSVNEDITRQKLAALNPDLILLNGTRIVGKKTLTSVNAPWINIHAGVTPKYRGVHGGYWALAEKDPALCGVSVHYVNTGIDTGDVIEQGLIHPNKADNFATYPYLQYAVGLQLLLRNLQQFGAGTIPVKQALTSESKLWYHPGIWGYLSRYISLGVK